MKRIVATAVCLLALFPTHAGINKPMMGWSSWNAFFVDISEDIICRQAHLMDSLGLKQVGYNYVNIDDGFFGYRDKEHGIVPNPKRFPRGMRVVTDYIHALDMKAGIYTDAGTRTCGSIWNADVAGRQAGIYGHEASDCKVYFHDWNFDFIKIDYCGGQDLYLNEQQRYTDIYNAIMKYGRPDVKVNICRWAFPGTWAEKVSDSWRISGDIQTNWERLKYVMDKNMYLSAFARNGKYNDMDMLILGMKGKQLLIGEGLTDVEDETHFAIWCIMSSPLLIGANIDKLSAQSIDLLKNDELIAINQDELGLQARVYQREGEAYVLAKDIQQREGTSRAVALLNASNQPHTFRVALKTLCLAGKTQVRDLLHRKNLKSVKDSIIMTVEPHATACLRLTASQRLEADTYEAEWAYLPLFHRLVKDTKTILFAPIEGASGGMGVSYVGGKPNNVVRWDDVYSQKGGQYMVHVSYVTPKEDLTMILTTNGQEQSMRLGKTDKVKKASFPVTLRQGWNTIEIGNPYDWAPDIDKITLEKQ